MGSFTDGLTSDAGHGFDDYYLARPFLEMIRGGELPESAADEKARRILRLIFRTAMNAGRTFGRGPCLDHYAAAKGVADESIVLLRNNGLLPLEPREGLKLLVVGENAVRRLNEGADHRN